MLFINKVSIFIQYLFMTFRTSHISCSAVMHDKQNTFKCRNIFVTAFRTLIISRCLLYPQCIYNAYGKRNKSHNYQQDSEPSLHLNKRCDKYARKPNNSCKYCFKENPLPFSQSLIIFKNSSLFLASVPVIPSSA